MTILSGLEVERNSRLQARKTVFGRHLLRERADGGLRGGGQGLELDRRVPDRGTVAQQYCRFSGFELSAINTCNVES
jgi:hypothetical protein